MKTDDEVEQLLLEAGAEIEKILFSKGLTLTTFPDHGIGVQHEQMHPSGDLSIRAVEITNAPF